MLAYALTAVIAAATFSYHIFSASDCNAKITQLQVSIPGQQQVCRLDVTMHLLPLR
jgi:hypothetical protein